MKTKDKINKIMLKNAKLITLDEKEVKEFFGGSSTVADGLETGAGFIVTIMPETAPVAGVAGYAIRGAKTFVGFMGWTGASNLMAKQSVGKAPYYISDLKATLH